MATQPAFVISQPMQNREVLPDYTLLNRLTFGMGMTNFGGGGLPTFFPVGNRAANSASDPWSGKPNGLRMLVVAPTRYNAIWRTRRTPTDARLPNTNPQLTRTGTPSAPAGS